MEKMTKKDYLGVLRDLAVEAGEQGAVEFCEKEIERLANRKFAQTKTQKENEGLVEVVYEALARLGKPATVAEIQAEDETIADFSNQKMSALLKKLVDTNRVVRVKDKKVTLFSIKESE
ncbi:MAG: hypothetical protein ACI4PE_03400 [Bacilli bacterium]